MLFNDVLKGKNLIDKKYLKNEKIEEQLFIIEDYSLININIEAISKK